MALEKGTLGIEAASQTAHLNPAEMWKQLKDTHQYHRSEAVLHEGLKLYLSIMECHYALSTPFHCQCFCSDPRPEMIMLKWRMGTF